MPGMKGRNSHGGRGQCPATPSHAEQGSSAAPPPCSSSTYTLARPPVEQRHPLRSSSSSPSINRTGSRQPRRSQGIGSLATSLHHAGSSFALVVFIYLIYICSSKPGCRTGDDGTAMKPSRRSPPARLALSLAAAPTTTLKRGTTQSALHVAEDDGAKMQRQDGG